jgi:exonuclease VII large subunit
MGGGGKGGSAPPPPDYSQIAQSDTQAAQIAAQTAQNQLDWSKQQYNDMAPYTKQYMTSMANNADAATEQAQQAQQFYDQNYQPIEKQFTNQVENYMSPAQTETNEAAAEADVTSSFNSQRQNALTSLEGYGIDPSQTRYGALDLGMSVSQAAATAAAGTQSRQNTMATGLALENDAINIGRGYAGTVAQDYSTATSAGGAGVNAGLNTSATYGSMMGSPTQWQGLSNQGYNSAVGALNTGYQNELSGAELGAQEAGNTMSGIGSLAGGALAVGAIAI